MKNVPKNKLYKKIGKSYVDYLVEAIDRGERDHSNIQFLRFITHHPREYEELRIGESARLLDNKIYNKRDEQLSQIESFLNDILTNDCKSIKMNEVAHISGMGETTVRVCINELKRLGKITINEKNQIELCKT